jgi:NAD(P)H-dependent flavin oxidoreductase YrpB (nitropropane dioxygenase family)
MRTRITDLFGVDLPVFAFSHCREVVAAVSRSGGVGVYGAATFSPERVEADIDWIAAHVDGRPYGIDVMMPVASEGREVPDVAVLEEVLEARIPTRHREFVAELLDRFAVPALEDAPPAPEDDRPGGRGWRTSWYEFRLGAVAAGGLIHAEIGLERRVPLIVSALGPPPPEVADRAREHGIKLGALVGAAKHAAEHLAAGVDLLVAQGTEAAAHTGDVSTMILVPEVVEVAHPTPVLAAGGVASGRAMAAALALGAEGVWTGSIWLASRESDEPQEVVDRLLAASSSDTVRSRCRTGKPLRQLNGVWPAAWDGGESPGTLPMPTQHLLTAAAEERFNRHGRADLVTIPVGQAVGQMVGRRPVAEIMAEMASGYEAATVRLAGMA